MFNGSFYDQNASKYPVLRTITPCYSIDHQVKPKTYDKMYQKLSECDYGGVKIVKYCFAKAQSMQYYYVLAKLVENLMECGLWWC